jgi:hypothetical protein
MEAMNYMEKVKGNGMALRHVPMELRTYELCLAAVEQDGEALEFVPEALITAEVCLAAVERDGGAAVVEEGVPRPKEAGKMALL